MRAIFIVCIFQLLLLVAIRTSAQQSDADRKSFEDTKAKAENGDPQAQSDLGNYYFNGQGVAQDFVEAAKWLRMAADQGVSHAQSALGDCYHDGEGVTQDYKEAVKWYRKAADQGLAMAQYNLGIHYDNGLGVTQDFSEAIKWFTKAADQGDAKAQYNVGCDFYKGHGVAQNNSEAVKWFLKAANQGCVQAQVNLGVLYEEGNGLNQNYVEAVKWYRNAASQGDAKGQLGLAHCYFYGHGVTQDYTEAAKWNRKAAEQGDTGAQFVIGYLYGIGEGVTQNDLEAYVWLSLAASGGFPNAVSTRDEIASRMSREEIIEGQHLAAFFVPHQVSSSTNSPSSKNPSFSGTGFFITEDGYLISNCHVVKDAAKVRLLTSAGLVEAIVVKVDSANDLALLKAEGRFVPLPVTTSRSAKLGNTVTTLGFPDIGLQGFSPKLARGEIASLSGVADDPRYFQISVPLQPGNSGGALVDEHGNVVGIVAAKLDAKTAFDATGALPENVNYAVKSSLLLSFLESVPDVAVKLKDPNTKDETLEAVVKSAQDAAVLVLVN